MLLGYDPRLYKLITFAIGGGVAGLAGCVFVNWGGFISPPVFGLAQSAQIIIFVLLGGLGTLLGPILGAFAVQYLITPHRRAADSSMPICCWARSWSASCCWCRKASCRLRPR